MVIWSTPWKKIAICDKCKNTTPRGAFVKLYCVKCGQAGSQLVRRRYVISLCGISKECIQDDDASKKFEVEE